MVRPGRGNDRTVRALVRVGEAVASTADYERALATLIAVISDELGVDTGGFMVFERERNELVLQQPGFGVWDARVIGSYHVPVRGKSNAATVFRERKPYVSNDARNDPRLVRRFVDLFDADNVLSVPLLVEGRPIGVFHAINKLAGPFDNDDVELLSQLAPLLAVTIQSARLFREVQDRRRQLERAIFLQSELSRTAFEAPGMEPLADRLSHLLNRPVMVLDHALSPLAAARWPADAGPRPEWLAAAGDQRPGEARLPLIAPIAVGAHSGGYLAVLEDRGPLDLVDRRALDHAVVVFALEMLREQNAYEIESRLKGDVLRDLVSGDYRDDDEAAALLVRLGYTVGGPFRVARLELVGGTAGPGEMQQRESRAYGPLTAAAEATLGVAAVMPWRSGFLLLVPAAGDDDIERAAAFLDRLATLADIARGVTPYLALGKAVPGTAGLGASLETAERALTLARTMGSGHRPMFYEHLGVHRLLFGPNDARDRREFLTETLGPLIDWDGSHKQGELVHTVRVLAESDWNTAEAARRLYIHTNTLKHRLKRIGQLLGGDPSKGDLRLRTELALKLLAPPDRGWP